MKIRKMRKNMIPLFMLGISFLGFALFYLLPFLLSSAYAMVDNPIRMKPVGLQNLRELFQNPYFMRGLCNTAVFMGISIPLNMLLSLLAALLVNQLKKWSSFLGLVFLIPLVLPTATVAFFWENIFDLHGILNRFLAVFGIEGIDWLQSKYALLVMVLVFLWKNIGYNMALVINGLNNIPEEYYECASVEGANFLWKLRKVTLVYLTPTAFLVFIMSFVNAFKVFKEIYIMTGQYPSDSLYLLQHYMNNMFLSLNYPKLVSAVYILTAVIVVLVVCVFGAERRVSKNLRY